MHQKNESFHSHLDEYLTHIHYKDKDKNKKFRQIYDATKCTQGRKNVYRQYIYMGPISCACVQATKKKNLN